METKVTDVHFNAQGWEIEETKTYEKSFEETIAYFETLGFKSSNINSLYTVMVHEDYPKVQDYIRIHRQ